jgi:hypothetical protein
MKWQNIETAPKDGTHILLRYVKNGKNVRTRVTGVPVIIEAFFVPDEDPDAPYAGWYDALERLIVMTGAPNAKNIPTHWMSLPKEP